MCTDAYREALTEEFLAATATTPVSSTAQEAATTPARPAAAHHRHGGGPDAPSDHVDGRRGRVAAAR